MPYIRCCFARPCHIASLAAGPLLWAGCASIPRGRAVIDSVEIIGARSVDVRELQDKLATSANPKLLGVIQGFGSPAVYDPAVLQRDLARVERYLQGRGFLEAHVRVSRVFYSSADHVRVEIIVDEGRPMTNGEVRVDGIDALPADLAERVKGAAVRAFAHGARFDEDVYAKARAAVLRALTDAGYAYATVTTEARADIASYTVDYVVTAAPGIRAVFGPITFVGLDPDGAGPAPQEIAEPVLRRVMHVREGEPYSTSEIDAATQALLDLEVFSAVNIIPGLGDPNKAVVPLVVQVEPTKLRAVRLGFGGEFDAIKSDVHGRIGWEDHNLLGGLRDLSVDLTPGIVLYPISATNLRPPSRYFYEQRLRVQLRLPGFIEPRTTGFLRPELNIYPLLVEPNPTDNEPVPNYIEPRLSLGLERRFGRHLFLTLAYNFQGEVPFTYHEPLDPTLPTLYLSFPQLIAQLDFKDDPVHPHSGFAANVDFQVAGGPFGGSASDVRIQPDVTGYVPIARGVTFALHGALGALFPANYGGSVEALPNTNQTLATDRDIEAVYFRGFFLGGASSNRGYPLRGVSPHGSVPFLNPATASTQAANSCDPNRRPLTEIEADVACLSPIGGLTMWSASAELRLDVSGPLGVTGFCDMGDASQYVLPDRRALRFNYLHMSCGAGARYDTAVGPIRLDIAYRIPPLQIVGQPNEQQALNYDPTFGKPPGLFGVASIPVAIVFGIGEAF